MKVKKKKYLPQESRLRLAHLMDKIRFMANGEEPVPGIGVILSDGQQIVDFMVGPATYMAFLYHILVSIGYMKSQAKDMANNLIRACPHYQQILAHPMTQLASRGGKHAGGSEASVPSDGSPNGNENPNDGEGTGEVPGGFPQ